MTAQRLDHFRRTAFFFCSCFQPFGVVDVLGRGSTQCGKKVGLGLKNLLHQ
jgi:hypothetical protein